MAKKLTDKQQSAAALAFAKKWEGYSYESGGKHLFWSELLRDVFGVEELKGFLETEKPVRARSTKHIDFYIPSTKVLIEHKSGSESLDTGDKMYKGKVLTPYAQALMYYGLMTYSERPRWIVTCNFAEFRIYDMDIELNDRKPQVVKLADLGKEYYRLRFLVQDDSTPLAKEVQVSVKAGKIIGDIHKALLQQYDNPSPEALRWLNILCVRLVFCLYAEDAGVFPRNLFHDYLFNRPASVLREALLELFDTLNTPYEKRSKYISDDLAAFPYTNGGLFAEQIEVPQITDDIKFLILKDASSDFDWSEISPTIFGAVFESTIGEQKRREGGMHYTSIENIHRVIDPLFLDNLIQEFGTAIAIKDFKLRTNALLALQQKLSNLTFFDPACGSGNFLTETYLSLRRLENRIIATLHGARQGIAVEDPVKVNIQQFHGIEIDDFAVSVATTALWIAEAQMLAETERIIQHDIDFLPLHNNANIIEGNALRLEWPQTDYIISNPPFTGARLMSDEQKDDLTAVFGSRWKNLGNLDYVCGWYKRAADLMQQHPQTRTALVSTNSITQGEQVASLWRHLVEQQGVHIDFAHHTFRWNNKGSNIAHVHCVIVGFSIGTIKEKPVIYDGDLATPASHINAYLLDLPDVWIESRTRPICDVPEMNKGSQPTDGGNLLLSQTERDSLFSAWPNAVKYIRPFTGADEFINNKARYCLWLKDADPAELRLSSEVTRRLEAVRHMRLASSKEPTRRCANTPTLFQEDRQPDTPYIIIPSVSSERRRYIPIGFLQPDVIASNLVLFIPNATLYHFGVLTSSVHMAWMRIVGGRLESRYRYSKDIVYNNFPWPENDGAFKTIEKTAQAILDARALFPNDSLADLYDPNNMPAELRAAHQANDRAVMRAYGFRPAMTEEQIIIELFRLYKNKIL